MSGLDSIPVRVEGGPPQDFRTDNLQPVLVQLQQAVEHLLAAGEETTIDLGAMPFSERDEADLRERLGVGEVAATLDAFGPTRIEETRFAGVWLIEHQDAEQRRLTLHLHVARVPEILCAPIDDIADGLAVLRAMNLNLPDS